MREILGKRRRHRDTEQLIIGLHVHAQLTEHLVDAGVELATGIPPPSPDDLVRASAQRITRA